MSIELIPGATYYAGADRPFFVSHGMIGDYLTARGFTNVQWHKRKTPLPSHVNPRDESKYSDDWDEWVSADYAGSAGTIDPPVDLPWVVIDRPPSQSTTAPATPSSKIHSWQAASEQASRAAAAAAIASQRAKITVPSSSVVPVPPSTTDAKDSVFAPREPALAVHSTGTALLIGGTATFLFGVTRAILTNRRRKTAKFPR